MNPAKEGLAAAWDEDFIEACVERALVDDEFYSALLEAASNLVKML